MAKIYSRLFDKDPMVQAKYLEQSLHEYMQVKLFVSSSKTSSISTSEAMKGVDDQIKGL